jgi:NAD(P)-dependent dehydrogenase (short-subunit alcohol dehydrogenase family)
MLEYAHCRSLIERAVSELGALDILVNNAAYQMTREGIAQIPDGEWEHTFRMNVSCPQYRAGRAPALDRSGPRRAGR